MGNKIIVDFQPFQMMQNVSVFKDNELVGTTAIFLDDLPNAIKALSNKHDCNEVELYGNKGFLKKIKAEILSKFNDNTLNIQIKNK